MADYDPRVIYTFADRLYARANSIIIQYTVLGALLGGGGSFLLAEAAGVGGLGGLVFGAALGGLAGFALGREKAFALKLAAQTALCQAQIEENTRSSEE